MRATRQADKMGKSGNTGVVGPGWLASRPRPRVWTAGIHHGGAETTEMDVYPMGKKGFGFIHCARCVFGTANLPILTFGGGRGVGREANVANKPNRPGSEIDAKCFGNMGVREKRRERASLKTNPNIANEANLSALGAGTCAMVPGGPFQGSGARVAAASAVCRWLLHMAENHRQARQIPLAAATGRARRGSLATTRDGAGGCGGCPAAGGSRPSGVAGIWAFAGGVAFRIMAGEIRSIVDGQGMIEESAP